MRHQIFWIILGIAVFGAAAGCGPKVVDVSGTVTYNGKPLNDEGCKILFQAPSGQEVVTSVAASGEYKASEVVAGPNKVALYYVNTEGAAPRAPGVKAPPSVSPLRNLPFKYADVKTSELKVNADTGTVFNVDMQGPPLK
jgi:hypothetical protein